ncbi:MAG: tripartite tricarboxylate transporter TctB family protein [Lachnospiraceae bacterium]|nr:tripartite tricarboxylate transporter TctB family protein [Lachnospiraceae bacterium]
MAKEKTKIETARSDMATGGAFSIFSVLYFLGTFTFKIVELPNTVTAAFMPRVLGVVIFLCSAWVFLRGWRSWRQCSQEEKALYKRKQETDRSGQLRCILVVADLLVAAFFFKKLGFLLTMPWMMFILFLILEKKEKRNYKLYLLISIIAPVVVFFVFYYGFSQLLPMGILKPYLSQIL